MAWFGGSFYVYDSSGKQIAVTKHKTAAMTMARVVGGTVRTKSGKVVFSTRNPVQKKKKKTKAKSSAKRAPAKKNKKGKPKSKRNAAKTLRDNIAKMKPGSWYDTTLKGAKVKVQRKGGSLIIRPATKKRSR